jgi:hypothetical protein
LNFVDETKTLKEEAEKTQIWRLAESLEFFLASNYYFSTYSDIISKY